MGGPQAESFLGWLASDRKVAASTHEHALSALLFLCPQVLGMQLPWMSEVGRPRVQRRLPVLLSQAELTAVFRSVDGEHRLFAPLLCGTGLRLSQGLLLRVKDVDFARRAVMVRRQERQGQAADAAAEPGSGAARATVQGACAVGC